MRESSNVSSPTPLGHSRSDQIWALTGMLVGALIPIGFFSYDTYATSVFLATLTESEQQQIVHCGMPVFGLFFGIPMLATVGWFAGFGLSRLKRLM